MSTKIIESRLHQAEFVQRSFVIHPEIGTTPEELLTPEYWQNVAHLIPAGSLIQAVPEGMAWFAEFYVVSASRTHVKLKQLRHVPLDEVAVDEVTTEGEEGYDIKWGSPSVKFRVIRKGDLEVVASGFGTKEEAKQAIQELELELA